MAQPVCMLALAVPRRSGRALAVITRCRYEYHCSSSYCGRSFVTAACPYGRFISLGAATSSARCCPPQGFTGVALVSVLGSVDMARISDRLWRFRHHVRRECCSATLLDSVGCREYCLSDSPVSAETQTEMKTANKPAAGNAGIASRLTIEHQRRGVTDPGRWP